jgi:hypothetical protein
MTYAIHNDSQDTVALSMKSRAVSIAEYLEVSVKNSQFERWRRHSCLRGLRDMTRLFVPKGLDENSPALPVLGVD